MSGNNLEYSTERQGTYWKMTTPSLGMIRDQDVPATQLAFEKFQLILHAV